MGLLTVDRADVAFTKFFQDQRFITAADLRQLGYAPADEVRQLATYFVQSETAQFTELRAVMQTLFDQTRDLSSEFDARVATATAEVLASQPKLMDAFNAGDKQLQEHIDTAQRNSLASLELLKRQFGTFTEQKQGELLSHCEGRLPAMYDKVIADTRAHFGDSRPSADGADPAFGKGAPRERMLFDARDYKIPELVSDPSLAVFKKWKHDLALFVETIGPSWKGVPRILRTFRFPNTAFTESAVIEMRGLKTTHEPDSPDLDYGFDFFGKAHALYKLLIPRLPTSLGTDLRQMGVTNGFVFPQSHPEVGPATR